MATVEELGLEPTKQRRCQAPPCTCVLGPEEDIVCTACKEHGGHCGPCEHFYEMTHLGQR